MDKIKVGIYSDGFFGWGGGVDFIATLAYVIEASEKAETYLIIKEDSFFIKVLRYVKWWLQYFYKKNLFIKRVNAYKTRYDNLINGFSIQSPQTKVLRFKQSVFNQEVSLAKCLKNNLIECLFPVLIPFSEKFPISWIAYLYDFQHKYLIDNFTTKEILNRDAMFKKILLKSRHVLVNAKSVGDDVHKFFPENNADIIVLPFKPFLKPELRDISLDKYNLPKKYFMVSCQFWKHKSHITVFEALEDIYSKGYTDIHIVCTGELMDYRDPKYIENLKLRINNMKCKGNIHLLAYIPKDDQIKIMNGAIGLIQPSLFEGGAGASGVIYAVGLGIPCFVSDIDVNKEIVGINNVYLFEKQNAHSLSDLLLKHSTDERLPPAQVDELLQKNLYEYSSYLVEQLKRCIKEDLERK